MKTKTGKLLIPGRDSCFAPQNAEWLRERIIEQRKLLETLPPVKPQA